MEKLVTWLIVLIAVVFLARPQSTKAVEEQQQYVASAECVENESDSGSIILTAVIIVIIIGAIADACGTEKT